MTPIKVAAGIAAAGVLATGGTIATDKAINPYDNVGTTLQAASVSSLPDAGTEKAIIDTTQPKITLEKWNGETAMSVRLIGMHATGARPFFSKNVEWKEGNQTMQVVPLDKSAILEDGGYEINIVLGAKPSSNIFNFSINGAQNLDFFYQPPLTAREIKEGASRPDNVIGSYAVYYKNHQGHIEGQKNYATGKAYHIFRPLVTDARGITTWANLLYKGGILSVTVPQTFLNNAAYPVTIDPTFGYTTLGGSKQLIASGSTINVRRGNGWSIPEGGTLSKITVGMIMSSGSASGNVSSFVNIENTGTGSNSQVAATEVSQSVTTSSAFFDFTAASQYMATGPYILNVVGDGASFPTGLNVVYDTASIKNVYFENFGSYVASKESPWTNTASALGTTFSIYATYSASTTASASDNNQVIFFQ